MEPRDEGRRSQVTITIDTEASPGLMGQLRRLIVPLMTRLILRKTLQLLADYLATAGP